MGYNGDNTKDILLNAIEKSKDQIAAGSSAAILGAAIKTDYTVGKNQIDNVINSGVVKIDEDMIKECQKILNDIKTNLIDFKKYINKYENALVDVNINNHMSAIDEANWPVEYKIYSSVGNVYGFVNNGIDTIYKTFIGEAAIIRLLDQLEAGFKYMLTAQNDFSGRGGSFDINPGITPGVQGSLEDNYGDIPVVENSGDTTGDVGNPNSNPDGEVVTSLPGVDNEDVVLEDDDIILEDDPIIYDGEYPEDENIVVEEIDNNQNNSIWNDDLLNGGLGAGVGSGVVYPWVNDWNNNWDNTGNNPWDQNWNDNVGDPVIPNPEIPNDNEENKDDGKPEVEFVNIGSDEVAIETPLVAGIGGGIIGNIGAGGGSTITKPEFNDPTEDKKEPNISYTINDMEFINPAENDPRFMANDDLDTLVDSDNVDNLDDNIIDSAITDSTINNEENNLEIDNITDIFDNDEVDNLDTENEPEFFKTAGVAGIGLAGLAGVGLKKDKDKEKKKDE